MQGIALTNKGLETVTKQELQELGVEVQTVRPGVVFFHTKDIIELCRIAYQARSVTKILKTVGSFSHDGEPINAISRFGKTVPWKEIIAAETSFVITTAKYVEEPSSPELCQSLGETVDISVELDYRNPDQTIVIVLEDKFVSIGLDLGIEDLGKRTYRVFLDPAAIKGHIAYSLVRMSGFKEGLSFLDPFCRSGIIPIEAALWISGKSPHFFDKEKFVFTKLPCLKGTDFSVLFAEWDKVEAKRAKIIAMDDEFRFVQASKKNAKIAGVIKELEFSRTDLEWLDSKCPKGTIECIATIPPQPSSHNSVDKVEKELRQFFYQAEFICSKKVKICLLIQRGRELIQQLCELYHFRISSETPVSIGKENASIIIIEK